jgi:hypothetical protein
MRHVLPPSPITTVPLGMGKSPIAARLVSPSGLPLGAASGLAGTAGGTVHMAPITMAADQHVSAAAAAQKQARRSPARRVGAVGVAWTQCSLSATMPLHACPARCRARRRWKLGGLWSAPCLPLLSAGCYRTSRRHATLRAASNKRKIKEVGKAAPLTARASLWSGLRPSRRLARAVSPTGNHGRH